MRFLAKLLPIPIFLFWLAMLFCLIGAFVSPFTINVYRVDHGIDPLSTIQMALLSLTFFIAAFVFYGAAKMKLLFVVIAPLLLHGLIGWVNLNIYWHVITLLLCLPVLSVLALFVGKYMARSVS